MIKTKDGYAKLIGTTYQGISSQVLLSDGGNLEYSSSSKASTLVQRNSSQQIYATYFNSAISDESLSDIGSVYVRNTSDSFIRRISKSQFYSIIDGKFVTLDTSQTITGSKTFTTPINNSYSTNTYLAGNQGKTLINSTASAGAYVMLFKGNSTNGYFTHGVYQGKYLLQYTAKSTVTAGTNSVTKSTTLLDESGNSQFPGNVTAPKFIGALQGNADSATKLTTSAGSSSLPIYFADGKPIACTASSLFSNLSNSGNNISITIAGQNRTLAVNYSEKSKQLYSYLLPYTGSDKLGWYCKIASISITSRYSSKTALLCITDDYTTSSNSPRYGFIYVKVQQQDAFGSSPNITLRVSGSLTTSLVTGILTLSSSSSKLDIYLKEDLAYQIGYISFIHGVSDIRTNSQDLIESLPSGTVINSQYGDISNQAASLLTSRKINGTLFNGTSDITTTSWGSTRTISLTGAVTGSVSTNGSGNITINTTYGTGNITNLDNRYLKKTGDTMNGVLSFHPTGSSDASPKIYSSVDNGLTSLNFEVADDSSDRFVFKINYYNDTNTTNRERFTIDWSNVISKAPITAPSFNGNATSATNADKLDGVHLNGIFTNFAYSQSKLTATIGSVSKTVNIVGAYPSTQSVTMNTIASYGNCMGMASLASSNSNVNPNNQTGWHHFINMSYNTKSDNMWQSQIAIKAGTTEVWVRSRSGGTISDSSAWGAPWVRLARTTDTVTNSDKLDGVHANGLLTALTSNSTTNLSLTVGGTTKTIADLYATQAVNSDTLDGVHLSGLFTSLSSSSSTNLSITVGKVTKTVADLYATQAVNADTVDNFHSTGTSGNVIRKSGSLTSATAGLSSYWGKVASFTWVDQYNDQDITLYMHSAYNAVRGIVHIRARWSSSSSVIANCWVVTGNLDTNDLRLYYNASSATSPLELWYNVGGQYGVIHTIVLTETGRTSLETFKVTLYNTSFTTVQTPSISTYVTASYIHLYNSVDIANKLGTSTVGSATVPIYLSSGSPKACSASTSDTANTIAVRNGSGDIACRLVRPTYANQSTISGALAFRVNNSSDNYIRFCSDTAAIRTWLGVSASNHNHDDKYVNVSGDTMTGLLTVTSGSTHKGIKVGNCYLNAIDQNLIIQNINSIRFGSDSWAYNDWGGLTYKNKTIYLGAADGTIFSQNTGNVTDAVIKTPGINKMYIGNNTTNLVWHAGNDGSGSGLDADTVDGQHASSFATSSHNHGTLHSNFTVWLASTTTDSGWSMINSSYSGFLLKSIRTQSSAPSWIENNYAAGICFGGADTKGVLSIAYNSPYIRFAGGNGSKPVWWMRITGVDGETYNLEDMWTGTRYWANIAVSTSSSTSTSPTFGNITVNSQSTLKGNTYMQGASYLKNNAQYPNINFMPSFGSSTLGTIYYNAGSDTSYTASKFFFRQYSYSGGSRLSYYEDYNFPNTNSGRSSNASYYVLTTKNTSVSGGGSSWGSSITVTINGTSKTLTIPSNPNTDTKVTNTLKNDIQFYITGTSSNSTNTGTQYFDSGVYVTSTSGQLSTNTIISRNYAYVGNHLYLRNGQSGTYADLQVNIAGTTSTNGVTYFLLGNGTASGTTNNAQGVLRLYGTSSGYTNIRCGTNNTTGYTLYLPGANGQLVYHTNDTTIGSSTKGVYISSSGEATAMTYSLNAAINSGTAGKLAYYSGTNTIDDYTTNVGDVNTPIYISGGVPTACNNYFMRAILANGYYGIARPDGNTSGWIRTTSSGILPYQSGGSTTGHCGIGTSTWYFRSAYIQEVYSYKSYASEGFYEESDIRLKENICPINPKNDIELVAFNWKKNGNKSYGVIAQDVEKFYPELVSINDLGYKTVNYDALLILKIAYLENKIRKLEEKLLKL